MSKLNSITTADYIPWDEMQRLVRSLYEDGNYRFSLLVGCGCYFGLRISDLLTLRWSMLMGKDSFVLTEKKTGKHRTVRVNAECRSLIRDCHEALHISDDSMHCFSWNSSDKVYSVQRINSIFKDIKAKYRVSAEHFSTHSMRKTFGRRVVEHSGHNPEMALIILSELFNHSSTSITRRYLGLRSDELLKVYDLL